MAADLGAARTDRRGSGPGGGNDRHRPDAVARRRAVLGRALGARWIVTGGYQRLGGRLRITARLVDVTTGAVRRAVVTRTASTRQGDRPAGSDRRRPAVGRRFTARPVRVARAGAAAADGVHPPAPAAVPALQDRIAGRRTACDGAPAMAAEARPSPAARNGRGGRAGVTVAPCRTRRPPEPEPSRPRSEPAGRPAAARPRPRPAWAGSAWRSAAGILTGRPSVRPMPGRTTRPRIDGRLDDAVWRRRDGRHRLRAADAARRGAGHGADRGLPRLRHPEHLHRRARPLLEPGRHPCQPLGPRPDVRRRHDHRLLRPVPRSAARLRLLRERLRRAGRRHPRLAVGRNGHRRRGRRRRRRGRRRRRRRPLGPRGRRRHAARRHGSVAGGGARRSPAGATRRGTRCSTPAARWSRTAGRRRWRSRSRASATRSGDPARSTAGASRSCGPSRARRRPTSGRPSRATSPASCRRWACSTA